MPPLVAAAHTGRTTEEFGTHRRKPFCSEECVQNPFRIRILTGYPAVSRFPSGFKRDHPMGRGGVSNLDFEDKSRLGVFVFVGDRAVLKVREPFALAANL